MKSLNLLLMAIITVGLFGCGDANVNEEPEDVAQMIEEDTVSSDAEPQGDISLTEITDSPQFPDATLKMVSPEETVPTAGTVKFDFDVTNYELGVQTEDAETKSLANSGDGQHIHLIKNNNPYTAHYQPEFEGELPAGNHVILAFLSRSYHESVKSDNAYVLRSVNVGEGAVDKMDLSSPLLFYSRPKGPYSGPDTAKILLDFYLVNVDLSPDGYKVKALIDGQEFMIDKWAPYAIEGLGVGEHTIEIMLLDKDGNVVEGPFNRTSRTITLSEKPMEHPH